MLFDGVLASQEANQDPIALAVLAAARERHIVKGLGKAVGLTNGAHEPLHASEKIKPRDQSWWEPDPASSEGYEERMKRVGKSPYCSCQGWSERVFFGRAVSLLEIALPE
ncbi:MAG: DUF6335 family protein [Terriglobia bacterium]